MPKKTDTDKWIPNNTKSPVTLNLFKSYTIYANVKSRSIIAKEIVILIDFISFLSRELRTTYNK